MEIKSISYPNTVRDDEVSSYSYNNGYRFHEVWENGEMALVRWILVKKIDLDGEEKPVAKIKESVCDIYY